MAVAALFLFSTKAQSATPTFHPSLKLASEAAAADQSLVLLIFGAEWCQPCKLLETTTLAAPEFLNKAGALHITEVDIDADSKTARAFGVNAVPDLVLLTADGKIVLRETGYKDSSNLLAWTELGRTRAKTGNWQGTAPGAELAELAGKMAADGLTTNELQRLIVMLGDPDPANRGGAAKILLAQRELAVPALIEGLSDPYLGVRIGANDLLQRLAPDQTAIDPWESPAGITNAVERIRQWWTSTGKLPPASAPTVADATTSSSVQNAIAALKTDDPVNRTKAMATLVSLGNPVLPSIREALKKSESSGDHRSISFLEDVRWAILIPDSVERRVEGARRTLARGRSPERQAIAGRLSRVGREALPALTELANDGDPLVVESAVRALSGVGGKDSIPAMAALLNAADSNLRMTAAQALGKTKSADAIKPLLTVVDDPDEVVACAALAALEQIKSDNRSAASEDIVPTLKRAVADPRWRVRAAAVEVVGKMGLRELTEDLKALLEDSDGFVIRNVLTALNTLNANPDSEKLLALSKRLPGARTDIVTMLLGSEDSSSMKAVTEIFNTSSTDQQVAILGLLIRHGSHSGSGTDSGWKTLLTKATTANDPRLRRAAAEALGKRSPTLAAEMIGPLLSDSDGDTRAAAAGAVLALLGKGGSSEDRVRGLQMEIDGETKSSKTNKAWATPERLAAWHTALLQRVEPIPDPRVGAALFVTGDGKSDLPMLLSVLNGVEGKKLDQFRTSGAIGLVLSKLSWPDGKPVVEKFCSSVRLYAAAVEESGKAAEPVADFLLEPARFKMVLDDTKGEELIAVLELVAGDEYGTSRSWSLFSKTASAKAIVSVLLTATNAAWRAASVYALGLEDNEKNLPTFERALTDSNSWVRRAAVQAIARKPKDRSAIEARLGPMLADTNSQVAVAAAAGLLESEIRSDVRWLGGLDYFQFETFTGGIGDSSSAGDERPLTPLESKPPYLEYARQRLAGTNVNETIMFALLLAQHGQAEGTDWLVSRMSGAGISARGINEAALIAIALSRDAKYLPVLQKLMEARTEESELREVLRALRGMTGPEVRQLRLEVNKRIRQNTGSSGSGMIR